MASILVRSLMLREENFLPLEIEIQLVPGLPTIQFLGLPSPGLKESALRIRSALRSAGFQLPKGRQILVDIRPRDEKKSGRGVDLAVALGYLKLTDQLAAHDFDFSKTYFYGDIGLGGDIMAPPDWPRVRALLSGAMVTGVGPLDHSFRGGRNSEGLRVVERLAHLHHEQTLSSSRGSRVDPVVRVLEPSLDENQDDSWSGRGVQFGVLPEQVKFETSSSEILLLAALGGHSLLMAGPQGTGKSTLARFIHLLKSRPTPEEQCEIETWSGETSRPLIEPHHTASELAMVGGRQPPRPGAITRAHLGTLLMDEVLLFKPEVQEALREPLETGVVHLARGPASRKFPADFQLLGTTNLCDCGLYTPTSKKDSCQCSSRVRARFDNRLRGPFVDRFQMLAYTDEWSPVRGHISFSELKDKVSKGREFQISRGQIVSNRHFRPTSENLTPKEQILISQLPPLSSERRRLSILRVARTWADLELREEISAHDIFRARTPALCAFDQLRSIGRNSESWERQSQERPNDRPEVHLRANEATTSHHSPLE